MKPSDQPRPPSREHHSERAALEAAVLHGESAASIPDRSERGVAWTLLVVEDDADTRSYVSHCLETAQLSRPVQVLAAADGAEALRVLQARPIDLVITDVHMPGLDGAGLAAQLDADGALAALPVLFISGDAEAGHALEGTSRRFLLKPFNRRSLTAAVQALLGPADAP